MSMVPMMFRNWWDDQWNTPLRTSRMMDQHFGTGLTSDDLLTAITTASAAQSALANQQHRHMYNRPWRHSTLAGTQDVGSTVKMEKDRFQINLDVQHFAPEEITVKAIDRTIMIEGRHEEKEDEHGMVTRHFVRKYLLPAGHDADKVVSSLSSDGVLTITAPKLALPAPPEGAKPIPIVQTGQPQKKPLEAPKKKTGDGGK